MANISNVINTFPNGIDQLYRSIGTIVIYRKKKEPMEFQANSFTIRRNQQTHKSQLCVCVCVFMFFVHVHLCNRKISFSVWQLTGSFAK